MLNPSCISHIGNRVFASALQGQARGVLQFLRLKHWAGSCCLLISKFSKRTEKKRKNKIRIFTLFVSEWRLCLVRGLSVVLPGLSFVLNWVHCHQDAAVLASFMQVSFLIFYYILLLNNASMQLQPGVLSALDQTSSRERWHKPTGLWMEYTFATDATSGCSVPCKSLHFSPTPVKF